jgi:hypothetical protein
MMFSFKKLLICSILAISYLIALTNSEVVCSEDELVRELVEDLEDNGINKITYLLYLIISIGKLDCLRESVGPKDEKPDQRAKRLAANWDSDCSFEANNPGRL